MCPVQNVYKTAAKKNLWILYSMIYMGKTRLHEYSKHLGFLLKCTKVHDTCFTLKLLIE